MKKNNLLPLIYLSSVCLFALAIIQIMFAVIDLNKKMTNLIAIVNNVEIQVKEATSSAKLP